MSNVVHPAMTLDDVVHQRVRLGILTILNETTTASFTFLRDALSQSGGNLSQHLGVLERHQFVKIAKEFRSNKPHTTVRITPAGRRATEAELAALRQLSSPPS
ncbi:MAG: transcriptional regulator [Candidatus Nanopelagicales bacterium]|nr:transcriptional regulator [Candidatus Nanopelagicales bacterium]